MTRLYRVNDDGLHQRALAEAATPRILDCDSPRAFWVAYGNGLLIVGKGQQILQNIILDTIDADPAPIHELAMSADGATWHFDRDYGMCVSR